MHELRFLRITAIAALITAFTTIGIHFIEFPSETFDQRLLLPQNQLYIAHKWMIIVHCLMVIISMCGVATLAWQHSKGLAALGFLFFSVFGIAEITRMFSVLAYLNPLREKYLEATDTGIRQLLQMQIDTWSQHGSMVLFLLFISAFALGNLFYGLSLFKTTGLDKWMAWGFLLCALTTSLAFGNSFWDVQSIGHLVEASSKFFQPLIRLAIGIWLWRKASTLLSIG